MGRALRAALARSSQFILLAFLLAAACTYASTLAGAMFLSHVGAAGLPAYYIGFAVFSIPVSFAFSAVINRWPRARIMTALLGFFMAVATLSALVLGLWHGRHGYYGFYIGISMSELLLYSVYYVLLADHFTITEARRLTGPVAMSMALGGLAGGGLVGLVAPLVAPSRALWGIPLLIAGAMLHLAWLTCREQPLDEMESAAEEGLLESLRILPKLARRYPIVTLLALAVFLNIFLQCMLEYVVFSIYARHYSQERDLVSFLGIVNAGLNVAGVVIVILVTERLLPRLGVARMNLVYPLLSFGSFALLAVNGRLPAAIFGHVVHDPFEHGVDMPVFAMNYNAIPRRFVGRVRLVNDGVVYPLALAMSGVALLLVGGVLNLSQISMIGAGLSLVCLAVHWSVGNAYLRNLLEMLRGGTIDLDQAGNGFRVSAAYEAEVASMLASDDEEAVALGLEMAARCWPPPMQPEIERVLPLVSGSAARLFLGRLARQGETPMASLLERLLDSADPVVRVHAIEATAVHGLQPTRGFACFFDDPDQAVRVVAAAANLATDPHDRVGATSILAGIAEEEAGIGVVNVLRHVDPRVSLPLLEELAGHTMAPIRAAAFRATAAIARPGDVRMLALGWCGAADEHAAVRAAAISLLAAKAASEDLGHVAGMGFCDPLPEVRQAAARALSSRGGEGLEAVRPLLNAVDPDVVDAAIEAIGAVGGRQADDILFDFLNSGMLPLVATNAALGRTLPANRPGWHALAIAIADSNQRAVHLVLHCLSALGYRRTVNVVRTMLAAGDARIKANAIETLSSLAHRRFVLPLLPLLEGEGAAIAAQPVAEVSALRRTLDRALASTDHWIRAGAVVAWQAENGFPPVSAITDFHPVVADTAGTLMVDAKRRKPEDLLMNRIAFLKSVPLFEGLSLDNLVAIEEVLSPEAYLEGEAIVTEGEVGDRLFIVYEGEVRVLKRQDSGVRELARLTKGAMFGEMSLFDDEPRSATVSAADDTEVLALERERFYSLVQQRPQILMQMCKVLVNRLRVTIS